MVGSTSKRRLWSEFVILLDQDGINEIRKSGPLSG